MSEAPSYPPGTPSWVDMSATGLAGAVRFYTELFGCRGERQEGEGRRRPGRHGAVRSHAGRPHGRLHGSDRRLHLRVAARATPGRRARERARWLLLERAADA